MSKLGSLSVVLTNFQKGDAIYPVRGIHKNQIGMVFQVDRYGTICVQFGAGGPFRRYSYKTLRYASIEDVKRSGLLGCGFAIKGVPS